MGFKVLQACFVGGELAPRLHGRIDLARYATGLKLCRNFIVLREGGITRRPGLRFCGETKGSAAVRLVPFVFSESQSYLLEFGHQYIRFWTAGGQVLDPATLFPYEISTPYQAAELSRIRFVQSADVLTLVHPNHAPRELARNGHTDWALSTIDFSPLVAAPTGLTATTINTGGSEEVKWVVTAVNSETGQESNPSTVLDRTSVRFDTLWENRVVLSWNAVSGIDTYYVYRSRNGSSFGFIGTAKGTTFTDRATQEAYDQGPPQDRQPFNGTGKYPAAVAYYQQRLVYARTNADIQKIWLSQPNNWHDFRRSETIQDGDAFDFRIAAARLDEIRNLVPLRTLLALTAGAEYSVGSAGEAVTPRNVSAVPQSYWGSSWLTPLTVGNAVLMECDGGGRIQELAYSFEADGYGGDELSVMASHFFAGKTVLAAAWGPRPYSCAWWAMSDGTLVSLTYLRAQQVAAWHRHETDGAFEDVCSIPEGGLDAVYVAVRRTINGTTRRYIERLEPGLGVPLRDSFLVDSGLTYDGRQTDGSTVTLSGGATYGPDDECYVTASTDKFAPTHVGGAILLEAFSPPIRLSIIEYSSARQVRVRIGTAFPADPESNPFSNWSLALTHFSGLSHIEGKTVAVLADGSVHRRLTVSGGVVDLDEPAAVVHVGLPFRSIARTLDVQGSEIGTRQKNVKSLSVRSLESRGFSAGPSLDRLDQYPQRQVSDAWGPAAMTEGIQKLNVAGDWAESGSVFLVQDDPVPLTVLSVTAEVEVGG